MAWTTARFIPGIGTITRSSRARCPDDQVGRDPEFTSGLGDWRLMNSIIPTRSGTRMTTRYAPAKNFSAIR